MSDDAFVLKIFTPVGQVLEDTASQVTLPSSEGEVGVLPLHVRYTALLGTGVLEYFSTEKKQAVRLVVAGGFGNFSDGEFSILADSVAVVDHVDQESYGAQRAELQSLLKEGDTQSLDWQQAKADLDKIEAIDRLISH